MERGQTQVNRQSQVAAGREKGGAGELGMWSGVAWGHHNAWV